MASCPKLNCTFLESQGSHWTDPPALNADPDISGYGVLIGFIGTGYITLILLIVQYVLGFIPDSHANPIDRGVLQWIWKRTTLRPSSLWGRAMEKCVLSMSDQQMVTGIAILASGYFQLCTEDGAAGIIGYDWEIIVYLGWFSSLTHLTTLTALRKYMIEHPIIRLWRLSLMLAVVAMLAVALVPTMQVGWNRSRYDLSLPGGVPAGCYYRSLGKPYYEVDIDGLLSLVVSLFVLLVGYTTKTIKLFPRQSGLVRWLIREAPGRWWKRRLERLYRRSKRNGQRRFFSKTVRVCYRIELAMLISIKAIMDIYNSVLWEVLWLVFGVGWGTMHLMMAKLNNTPSSDQRNDSDWGFGQFISTFLLALPLLSLAEACYETVRKLREERLLLEANASHLGSVETNASASHALMPLRQQSSSTLLLSPTPAPLVNSRTLSFPAVTQEAHIPRKPNKRSPSPSHQIRETQGSRDLPISPDADPDQSNLSLLYPLHDHDFYQFSWVHHFIIAALVEVILLGISVLYMFGNPGPGIRNVFAKLAPLWLALSMTFPTSMLYNYIGLYTQERREKRTGREKPACGRLGGVVLTILKWSILGYMPAFTVSFTVLLGGASTTSRPYRPGT